MRTWIFLRGLTRESAHWGSFPDDFRQAMPDARIISLDLPGNGQFHGQQSPLSVQAMVASCRDVLARNGERAPVYILAMSLGAMVATEWCRLAPNEIAGCVLINTSFRPFSPFYKRLRPGNYAALLRLGLLRGSPCETERSTLRLTSNRVAQRSQVINEWVDVRARRPVSPGNALRQLIAAARYRAPDTAPVPNMLLLASQLDPLVNSQCSQAIAGAWDRPLVFHPFAGHDLPLDDPLWVVEQVQRWLKK